ncbi:hypothetical protein BJ944DRAFT_241581 [Cunninghamella echinulata]|nr:hypothetical protein BJ944DRAFT_241581 [Cunninghamella echinulata]
MSSIILLFFTSIFVSLTQAANPIMFCKCFCGSNSTIFELPVMDKPCSNCTKQFCLDNVENGICDGIADETCPSNDFKTACFARDSFKDEIIVRTFLIAVFGLILFAVIKPFYSKWKTLQQSQQTYHRVSVHDDN